MKVWYLTKERLLFVLQRLCYLALFIIAILFTKDVLIQFTAHDTSLKQKEIPITEYPTFTICLNHPSGITYSYGTDFNISFDSYTFAHKHITSHEVITFEHDYEYGDENYRLKFKTQKAYSLFKNNCFKLKQINLGGSLELQDGFSIKLSFDETFIMEYLPNIKIYITSEENSYGIIFADWRDGDVLEFGFDRVKGLDLQLHIYSHSTNSLFLE